MKTPRGKPRKPLRVRRHVRRDVLLNHAAIDDYPLREGKPGWVSQSHRNLEVRMEQLSGERVQIARFPEEAILPAIEAELLQQVPKAKAMISVVSPPFIRSELCRQEVEQVWRAPFGLRVRVLSSVVDRTQDS